MRLRTMCGLMALLALAGCANDQDASVKAGAGIASNGTPLDKLKIEDTKVGTGPGAKNGDTLFVEYTGTLANGTKFDSTSDRGNDPFSFALGAAQVIKGWDQGLVGMKEGGQRRLSIPYSLAYGETAKGETIPAKSDLYFDIKLDKLFSPDDLDKVTVSYKKHGSGPKVKDGDTVDVLYTGTLINGKQFDTNREGGKPVLSVKKGAGMVVPGFDAALGGLQKGDEIVATIPPRWGYGMQGQGPIPANAWLIFDIEVANIKH